MIFTKRPKHTILAILFLLALALCTYEILTPDQVIGSTEEEPLFYHEILGSEEGCMGCHSNYTGFSEAHRPALIGCSPCHGGQPRETDRTRAHQEMIRIPGNLSTINRTCGAANCHGDIAQRVAGSLMATMSGVVAVDRFVFGASDSLSALAHVQELGLEHAADVHLRQLCASCHLGNEKMKIGPVRETSRGGGCLACHLNYSALPPDMADPEQEQLIHPAVNLKVTNDHCFGCHSRSGRIATNYEGWHETGLEAGSYTIGPDYRLLDDGRVFRKMRPDVHHELGLQCIDCHGAKELMGDGKLYRHQDEAVKIQCADCHFSESPPTVNYEELDLESKKILQLRGADYQQGPFVRQHEGGAPLYNVILKEDDQAIMVGKNSGQTFPLSPPADICIRGDAHNALTCSACHTGWAPQCVGCHNSYEPETIAFDQLDHQRVEGKWVEYVGEFFAEAPGLGVMDQEQIRRIKTFIPGMIMTIDASKFPGPGGGRGQERFHRLFAPHAAHTITREGRSCKSCHNNPVALGYGRGNLAYEIEDGKGRWQFTSEYQNMPQDGLPQDAWIGFMEARAGIAATRPSARPFNRLEQQRILQVGACLTCHGENSAVMQAGLENFTKTLERKNDACILPVWE